jgi:hypothetical protein
MDDQEKETCPDCLGTGKTQDIMCTPCLGTGIKDGKRCADCRGTGIIREGGDDCTLCDGTGEI